MNYRQFVTEHALESGEYAVYSPGTDSLDLLLQFSLPASDSTTSRTLARITTPTSLRDEYKKLVVTAVVRAGARHPGIRDRDLARLHKAAVNAGNVELFADLSALTTGLIVQLARSLGRRVGRVVISSPSIDVLHEHYSHYARETRRQRAEMVRALGVLDELRKEIPVHVHQLPPGTTRYFTRASAQPQGSEKREEGYESSLYISEDRQMVGAFWDYQTRDNPRVPLFLVTSDLSLAHVCAAERAPFIYAAAPFECWRHENEPITFDTLWFDPFALALRYCLLHSILWELCLIFGDIRVARLPQEQTADTILSYERRQQRPGELDDINVTSSTEPWTPQLSTRELSARGGSKSFSLHATTRKLKLSMKSIISVLPTRAGQRFPRQMFTARDEDSHRQLRQIGQLTRLFSVEGDDVMAGPDLEQLLDALGKGDYLRVNAIFKRHPSYAKVLEDAAEKGRFPNSRIAGTATGWAITLGAAYKSLDGPLFGLAEVSEERFEQAVGRIHRELGDGQQSAVPLPRVLDRTCMVLRISPVRFEVMLNQALGHGALALFEVQRASVDIPIPPHEVIASPTSAAPESYLRLMEPGKGIRVKRTLVSSLVRRSGGLA